MCRNGAWLFNALITKWPSPRILGDNILKDRPRVKNSPTIDLIKCIYCQLKSPKSFLTFTRARKHFTRARYGLGYFFACS